MCIRDSGEDERLLLKRSAALPLLSVHRCRKPLAQRRQQDFPLGIFLDAPGKCMKLPESTGDARYTPSNARLEARKLETQALHKNWRKEFRALQKRRPGMSDVWYSEQIARMEITPKRSAETIRKHMKR